MKTKLSFKKNTVKALSMKELNKVAGGASHNENMRPR